MVWARSPNVKNTYVLQKKLHSKLGGVPKDHPFTHREFPGAFKEVEDV